MKLAVYHTMTQYIVVQPGEVMKPEVKSQVIVISEPVSPNESRKIPGKNEEKFRIQRGKQRMNIIHQNFIPCRQQREGQHLRRKIDFPLIMAGGGCLLHRLQLPNAHSFLPYFFSPSPLPSPICPPAGLHRAANPTATTRRVTQRLPFQSATKSPKADVFSKPPASFPVSHRSWPTPEPPPATPPRPSST